MTIITTSVSDEVQEKYPKYRLSVYGEGQEYLGAVGGGLYYGIPVLFIPGNAGSYRQVRSMASVALRKAFQDDVRFKYHFNYFTIDFNEEYSALYGGNLNDQADFVAECVKKILTLYQVKTKSPPKSVVLIGHSIGGMVAKALFSRPDFDPDLINVIITLATPHQPVVLLDRETQDFYNNVNRYWTENRNSKLKDVTLVSVGGGDRDVQVRSSLTRSEHADVNVISTAAPSTWVSTDHQCIAWCKQLMLALNRALYDCVAEETYQITDETSLRGKIFNYHLLRKSAGKKYKGDFEPNMSFDKEAYWYDSVKRQFSFVKEDVKEDSHLLVKILDDEKHETLTIDAVNVDNADWLFGCKALDIHNSVRYCKEGDNLSDESYILPSGGNRKTATFNLRKLGRSKGYTHILIFIPKDSEGVQVHVDVYNRNDREVTYEVPRWISFWKPHVVIEETKPKAVYHNISLESLELPWQAYEMAVEPLSDKCKSADDHYGLMRFVSPWANDATQALIGFNVSNKLTAKLQTMKPADASDKSLQYPNPSMIFFLDPSCSYQITIRSSIGQMWGQMIRFYAPMVLPLVISVILITLVQQIKLFQKEHSFPSFLSVITNRVTPDIGGVAKQAAWIFGHNVRYCRAGTNHRLSAARLAGN